MSWGVCNQQVSERQLEREIFWEVPQGKAFIPGGFLMPIQDPSQDLFATLPPPTLRPLKASPVSHSFIVPPA